ncbi:unnamed protein product [Ilex paraguariensis]|uniref:Uncharacterized protein n=1 Tax=Ilex paraguariensis TaxID=185542 RepID=A0ABC8V4K4_9AQUA
MKWQGITAQATRAILQFTIKLTVVAISMEEIHWTITDIRSEIMVLTVEVSLMILEVSEPTLFSGFSNHANSFRSTADRHNCYESRIECS